METFFKNKLKWIQEICFKMNPLSSELPFHAHNWLIISLKDFCILIRKWPTFWPSNIHVFILLNKDKSNQIDMNILNLIFLCLISFSTKMIHSFLKKIASTLQFHDNVMTVDWTTGDLPVDWT